MRHPENANEWCMQLNVRATMTTRDFPTVPLSINVVAVLLLGSACIASNGREGSLESEVDLSSDEDLKGVVDSDDPPDTERPDSRDEIGSSETAVDISPEADAPENETAADSYLDSTTESDSILDTSSPCIDPCLHDSVCNSGRCECAGGWRGPTCNEFDCDPPCLNGALCIAPNRCDCDGTGFAGALCNQFELPGYARVTSANFRMGSPEGELGHVQDEEPHIVLLSHDYWAKITEVTQGEWRAVMGNSPSGNIQCGDACPVENVSWWDAAAFANKLSELEGLEECYSLSNCTGNPGESFVCSDIPPPRGTDCDGYRLPTEAEWEYLARGGTSTATYGGDLVGPGNLPEPVLDRIAWYAYNAGDVTHPVLLKEPNPFGLYDTLGNVAEWVDDWYGSYSGNYSDPSGPREGTLKVVRGGAINNGPPGVRASVRGFLGPGSTAGNTGFRTVRTIP